MEHQPPGSRYSADALRETRLFMSTVGFLALFASEGELKHIGNFDALLGLLAIAAATLF